MLLIAKTRVMSKYLHSNEFEFKSIQMEEIEKKNPKNMNV